MRVAKGVFFIHYHTGANDTLTCDESFADITAAYARGELLVGSVDDTTFVYLTGVDSEGSATSFELSSVIG